MSRCFYNFSIIFFPREGLSLKNLPQEAESLRFTLIPQHSQDIFNSWNSDEKMDVEDERKEILLRRLFQTDEDIETVYDRVHIPIGFDIFDIHKNLKKNNISTMGSMLPG